MIRANRLKSKSPLAALILTGSIGALLGNHSAPAAIYYWDDNAAGANFGTAGTNAGTWAAPTAGATAGWSLSGTGANAFASFTTGTADTLNFGNGATGLAAGTIIVAGTVSAGDITFASGSGAIVLAGGTINLAGTQTTTVNNASDAISSTLTGAATSFTKAGTGILVLNGVNTFSGPITISAGTLQIGTNNLSNNAVLGGGNFTGNILNSGTLNIQTNANQILSGVISGSGNLIKTYTGTLTLSGANTYTGKTFITPSNVGSANSAGILSVSSFNSVVGGVASSSLGAPTTVANGTIDLGIGTLQLAAQLRYTGIGETTDRVINWLFNGSISHTLDAANTAGLLTFSTAMTSNGAGTGQLILTNNVSTGKGEIKALPAVLPTGGLLKSGTGTWTLSGANTFTAPTTVSGGALILTNALALQNSALVTTGAGTYTITGLTTPTFGGLSGATGNLATILTGYGSVSNLTLNRTAGSVTYGGVIADGAAGMILTKSGAGTQILSGANSYTGATSVNAGTLAISSTGSLNNTAITVSNSGSTFAVNTTAAGSVNLGNTTAGSAGATLNLNGSGTVFSMVDTLIGTTNLQQQASFAGTALTVNNATLNFELSGATADKLALTNAAATASVTGTNTINLTPLAALTPGTYNLITTAAGAGGLSTGGTFAFANGLTTTSGVGGGNTYLLTLNNAANVESVTVATIAGGLTWTGQTAGNGATDSNWNTTGTSSNWATGATPVSFNNGTTVTFQDTNTVTAGNVTAPSLAVTIQAGGVAPTSTTFNNSAVNYTVSGGAITSGSLTKSGTGTVILANTNTYTGATTISTGTLQLGNGGTTGSIASTSSISIATNTSLVINNSATWTVPVMAGAGNVSYTGTTGVLTLNNTSSNNFSGGFTLNSGRVDGLPASGTYNGFGTGLLTINGGQIRGVSTTSAVIIPNDVRWNALVGMGRSSGGNPIFTLNGNVTLNGSVGTTAIGSEPYTLVFNGNIGEAVGSSLNLNTNGGGGATLNGQNTFTGSINTNSTALVVGGSGYLGGGNYAGAISSSSFTYSSSANQILSGVVTASTLTKNTDATSTLTLSGASANVISGLTTVTTGTLALNKSGAVNAIAAGGLTIGGNNNTAATVQYSATAGTDQIGASTVTINGRGILDLNGKTDTIGTLTIVSAGATGSDPTPVINTAGGGTLTIGTLNITPVAGFNSTINLNGGTLAPGATTFFNAVTTGQASITGNIDLGGATKNFQIGGGSGAGFDLDINGVISNGTLTKSTSGTGRLQFSGSTSNTYAGSTTVTFGTLQLNKSGTANAIAGGGLQIGTTSNNTASMVQYTGNSTDMMGAGAVTISGQGKLDFNGSTDTIGNVTVISTGAGANTTAITNTAGGGNLAIGTLAITPLTGFNSVINAGTLGTITLGGDVTFNAVTTGQAQITGGTLALGPATRTFTIGAATAPGQELLIDANISGSSVGLNKAGAGTLTLGGANNTYSGVTAISAGGLVAAANNALGTTAGNTTVAVGAALGLSGNINYSTAETIVGSNFGINAPSTGLFAAGQRGFVESVSGNNSFAGAIQINGANNTTSRFGTQDGAQLTLAGPITMASGTTGVTVLFRAGDINGDFVTVSNSGNNWDTATQVFSNNNGTGAGLRLGVNDALPIAAQIQALLSGTAGTGTTLDLAGFSQTTAGLTFTGSGVASLKISNSNTSSISVLTLNTAVARDSGNFTSIVNGAGTVQVVKTGASSQTLQGANTYSGGTLIKNGSMILAGGNDRLLNTGSLTLGDTGTTGKLVLGTTTAASNQTLAGLLTSGSGGSVVGANATTDSVLTLNIASGNNSFSGTLGGGGINENKLAVAKTGSGTLTLSGANSYTGATTVTTGALTLAGGSLAGTAVSVGGGGTLNVAGNYTVGSTGSGSVGVTASGGVLSLVDGAINTLTLNGTSGTNGLSLATGSILNFEVGATSDRITLGAGRTATTASGIIVNITSLGSLSGAQQTLISAPGGGLGTTNFSLGTVTGSTGGYNVSLNQTNNALLLDETLSTPTAAFWKGSVSSAWNAAGPSNFDTSLSGGVNTGSVPGSTTNVTFNASGAANTSTTLGQDFTINSLSFNAGTTGADIGGTNTLTVLAGNANGNTLGSGITVQTGAGNNTISSKVALGSDQTWTVTDAGSTLTASGNVSGAYGLTKAGAGTLILGGTNTYTGATDLNAGTLNVSGTLAGAVSVASGATLTSSTSLTLSGNTTFSGTSSYSGNITAPSGINVASGANVAGVGALTGSATTYGILKVSGSVTGNVDVQSGGTLAGTGSAGSVSVQSGGTLSPGNSPGIFTAGSASFGAGNSTYKVEIDNAAAGSGATSLISGNRYDQTSLSGNGTVLSLGTGSILDLRILNSALNGSSIASAGTPYNPAGTNIGFDNYFIFDLQNTAALIAGTFTNVTLNGTTFAAIDYSAGNRFSGINGIGTFTLGGQEYALSYQGNTGSNATFGGNDVVLTAIPEPGSLASLLGGLGLLVALQRRRRISI